MASHVASHVVSTPEAHGRRCLSLQKGIPHKYGSRPSRRRHTTWQCIFKGFTCPYINYVIAPHNMCLQTSPVAGYLSTKFLQVINIPTYLRTWFLRLRTYLRTYVPTYAYVPTWAN